MIMYILPVFYEILRSLKSGSTGVFQQQDACYRLRFMFSCKPYVHMFCLRCSQLLQLWEKNGYFDEVTIQQLQSPALGLGQYQVHSPTETYQAKNRLYFYK